MVNIFACIVFGIHTKLVKLIVYSIVFLKKKKIYIYIYIYLYILFIQLYKLVLGAFFVAHMMLGESRSRLDFRLGTWPKGYW